MSAVDEPPPPVCVKWGKQLLTVPLPTSATVADLRRAVAELTYVPPCAQKYCGLKGGDDTPLHCINPHKLMMIGTPAQDLSLTSRSVDMPALERIQRIVWSTKYTLRRPDLDIRAKAECCTDALLKLDAVDLPSGDTSLRGERRAAVAEVHALATCVE
eukprot:GGOE01044890.1.p3 GENE.GGOE01044890.1~~GGOE01044890.1.p3  ORF type:complete len:174 (+),score=41.54 GGOE01044890.1:50-523(+)